MSLTKVTYSMIKGAVVNVLDYGAIADNSTDNKAAFQAAINSAILTNSSIYIPAGEYRISGELTIPSGYLEIFGDGYATALIGTFATGNMFTIASENPVCFYNLRITSSVTKSSGSAIYYDAGTGKQNNFSVVDSCFFNKQCNGVYFYRNAYQKVTNCQFTVNEVSGGKCIYLGNATTPDAGDQLVAFNQFYGGTGVTCVYQTGGGGTRIIGNKFLQTKYGYYVNFGANAYSGIFIVSDNSFDGMTTNALSFITSDATAGITDVAITGNVFDGSPSDSFMNFSAIASSALGRIAITGNTSQQYTGSSSVIKLDLTGDATITGNSFAGSGSIDITSTCINPVVAVNKLENVTINNSCASALIFNTISGTTPYSTLNGSFVLNSVGTGGGQGVMTIGNAAVVPSGGEANSGVLYVQAGALKYVGSAGTVTTLASA